jgi:hypothetical protein
VRLPAAGGKATLRGSLRSIVPLDRLEVVRDGAVAFTIPLSDDRRSADFERSLEVRHSGWVTLQTYALSAAHPIEDSRPMATTNPVYFDVAGAPIRSRASAEYFLRWLEKLEPMVVAHPGWRSDKEKEHVLGQIREARAVYERRRNEGLR